MSTIMTDCSPITITTRVIGKGHVHEGKLRVPVDVKNGTSIRIIPVDDIHINERHLRITVYIEHSEIRAWAATVTVELITSTRGRFNGYTGGGVGSPRTGHETTRDSFRDVYEKEERSACIQGTIP